MSKRIVSVILLVIMMASVLGSSAFATNSEQSPATAEVEGTKVEITTIEADEILKGDPSIDALGCVSLPSITTQNSVSGGKARVTVLCTIGATYRVSMDLHMEARTLHPGTAWNTAAGAGKKTCRLGPIVPLTCTLEFDFPGTSAISTRQFRIGGEILVNGRPGIPIPTDGHTWVFNKNGLPYPKAKLSNRPVVHFPTYQGPWSGGDPRDQKRFIRECIKSYTLNGWLIPAGDVEYHHVHPLGNGGRNEGSNCYILKTAQHRLITTWWEGFRP